MLDTIEAACQRGSENEIEVRIGSRHAVLQANGPATIVDDAYSAGAVIHPPCCVEGSPGAFHVAFVRVNRGGVEGHKLWQFVEHTGQKLAHKGRHVALCPLIPEEIATSIAIPQAYVRVAATTVLLIVPLGHKASGETPLVANLFNACFEKQSMVRSSEGIGVVDIHLIHTWAMFTVVALDLNSMIAHHTGNTSQ